ncbi:hypothetical protein [Deinococcus peraridilitoris]|uniref:Uncharacterized protein n=1 Tax=Deinococcus peraridilitoris (strain DSM 19664 / LMG 22246 / CIP 109416 / KR-200) TaxID=937777 RepID=L0A5I4_DEIPD|nr:hypothetical protein [Deinococcus peraridilitoris]AFZ68694.1 hypothetical protein Deipe_3251 [Deinococcus peraridilitoris DSM 19664]
MEHPPMPDVQRDEQGNPRNLHEGARSGERYFLSALSQVVEVIAVCPVLWKSWEGDDVAYVVRLEDGSRKLISGLDEEELRAKISEYRRAIEQTEHLLSQL